MNASDKIHEVQRALHRAKLKISRLKGEPGEKEDSFVNEVELRTVAEKQNKEQDLLVDMYKANPKVNEELKERLPATKKHHCEDIKKQSSKLENSFQKLEAISKPLPEQTKSGAEMENLFKERKHLQNFVEKEDRVGLEDLESTAGKGTTSQDGRIETIENPHCGTVTDTCGGADQSYIIQEQACKEGSEPQTSHSSETLEIKNKTASSIARTFRTVSSQELRILHTGPQPQKETTAAAAVGVHENQGNTLTSGYLTPEKATPILDKDKNIAFLLKELDSMRDINKKLQDRLSGKERELETRKLDVELQDKVMEAHAAEQAAALVEEIYHAQRERDQAVMARLRLANEERDEALLRAKQLEQAIVELENINPEENDMSLQELLNRVNNADSGLLIEKSGAVIVDRIHKTRERRKKITAEEMNAVIEERDAAISKCKRLEQELHHLKEQSQTSANNMRHLTAENNQERALKAQLLSTQQERDSALQQSKKFEDEIQTLRVYYSLHKSLSQEASLKEQFQSTLSTYEDALHSKEGIVSLANLHNDQLITQLQLALSERANMEAQLQQSFEAQKEANEKVQKLERLVDVLRKKVGAGTVRTVI